MLTIEVGQWKCLDYSPSSNIRNIRNIRKPRKTISTTNNGHFNSTLRQLRKQMQYNNIEKAGFPSSSGQKNGCHARWTSSPWLYRLPLRNVTKLWSSSWRDVEETVGAGRKEASLKAFKYIFIRSICYQFHQFWIFMFLDYYFFGNKKFFTTFVE